MILSSSRRESSIICEAVFPGRGAMKTLESSSRLTRRREVHRRIEEGEMRVVVRAEF